MDIREIAEGVKSQVGLMIEDGDELSPVLFAVSGEEVKIVGFELNEHVKEGWQVLLPTLLHRFDAAAYIMVVEAWRSIQLAEDSPLTKRLESGELRVSQLPQDDKEEVVQMLVVENGKSFQCWCAKIKSIADRRFITGWEEPPEAIKIAGRMIVSEW